MMSTDANTKYTATCPEVYKQRPAVSDVPAKPATTEYLIDESNTFTAAGNASYANSVVSMNGMGTLYFTDITELSETDTFVFKADIKLTSVGSLGWHGPRINLRKTDDRNYYQIAFLDGGVAVLGNYTDKNNQDQGYGWGQWISYAYTRTAGSTIELEVVSEPTNISVYVNGIKIISEASIKTMVPYFGFESTDPATSYTVENIELYDAAIPKFDIVATAGANGSISPAGTTVVTQGNSQAYTITADAGYLIEDVLVDGASVGVVDTYTFTDVNEAHTISATFKAKPVYTITASADEFGNISPAGATNVIHGDSQKYIITALDGYVVDKLIIDGEERKGVTEYIFSDVQASHTIVAIFKAKTDIPLMPEGAVNLITSTTTATGTSEKNTYSNGVIRMTGFGTVGLNVPSLTADDTFVFSCSINPLTLGDLGWHGPRFNFRETASGDFLSVCFLDGGVSVYGLSDGADFGDWGAHKSLEYDREAGKPIRLDIVSEPEHVTVYVDGKKLIDRAPIKKMDPTIEAYNTDNKTSFVVSDIVVYKTEGVTTENTITATATSGGELTPSGELKLFHRGSQSFTITPAAGYDVKDVLVDGASVGAVREYTFEEVIAPHTIHVVFEKNELPDGTIIPIRDLKGEDTGSYVFENGNYFRIPIQMWQHQYRLDTDPLPDRFNFTTKVRYLIVDDTENYHGIRIMLKYKDYENHFEIIWALDGSISTVALVNNKYVNYYELGYEYTKPLEFGSSFWIELSCDNDVYTLWVDGVKTLHFEIPDEFKEWNTELGVQQSFVSFSWEEMELKTGTLANSRFANDAESPETSDNIGVSVCMAAVLFAGMSLIILRKRYIKRNK